MKSSRKSRRPTRKPRPARCRRLFCPRNRSRPRRAKSSRKRPSNSATCISPGTSPNCAIPTCRCSMCSPCCSAAAAVRGSISKCARRQGVVHHVDAWTYNPGSPGLFGMSAMVDADKFTAARDAMLAEIEKIKSLSVSSDEVQQGHQTIHLRHAVHAQDDGRPGATISAEAGSPRTISLFPNVISPPSNTSPTPTFSASPANISRRKTARSTRCCPNGTDTENHPRRLKPTLIRRSRNLNCPTACACS